MHQLYLDTWYIVMEFLKINEQLILMSVCQEFSEKLYIKRIDNVMFLNNHILQQKKFRNLEKIDLSDYVETIDISPFKRLTDLNAANINIDGIKLPKLIKLQTKYDKTFQVNLYKKLKKLTCLVSDYLDISELQLQELCVEERMGRIILPQQIKSLTSFTHTNHMFYTNVHLTDIFNIVGLKILHLSEKINIPFKKLDNLTDLKYIYEELNDIPFDKCKNLIKLDLSNSDRQNNINHLTSLEELTLTHCKYISEDVNKLVNIKRININFTPITNFNHMVKLQYFEKNEPYSGNIESSNEDISELLNLQYMKITNCHKITSFGKFINLTTFIYYGRNLIFSNIKYLVSLEVLSIFIDTFFICDEIICDKIDFNNFKKLRELTYHNCAKIEYDGLSQLLALEFLNMSSSDIDLNNLSLLSELHCCGSTLSQKSIYGLHNLNVLDCREVNNIYDLTHMKKLHTLWCGGKNSIISPNSIIGLKKLIHVIPRDNPNFTS